MISEIFIEDDLQKRFERDGYVVFDLLTAEEVGRIAEKFYELHQETPEGFYSAASSPDDEFKKSIREHAAEILDPKMDGIFKNFRKLGITFLSKAPGEKGKVPVHRDWMVVDESKYFSGTVWIPAQDTTEQNGALKVWPGSHKFFNQYRSSSIPVAYEGNEQLIWDQMITVPMKAGQAFLLNHAVIHASAANMTDKERLVIVCGIIPSDAKLMYYHATDRGTVEKFDMPDDMFERHSDIGGRPSVGVVVDEFPYSVQPESGLKIQQLITSSGSERSMKPVFNDSLIQNRFSQEGYVKLSVLTDSEIKGILDSRGNTTLDDATNAKLKALLLSRIPFAIDMLPFDVRLEMIEPGKELGPIHQDWTYTDREVEYSSITCQIPLVDMGIDNGATGFLKGSHLFLNNKRPSPQTEVSIAFKGNDFDLLPYAHIEKMKAGELLIFDHRIFNVSMPNVTDNVVPVINIKFAYRGSTLCHYYLKPHSDKKTLLRYKVDENFFRKYDDKELSLLYAQGETISRYESEEVKNYKYPEFTTADVIELLIDQGGNVNNLMSQWLSDLPAYKKYIWQREQGKMAKPEIVKERGSFHSDNPRAIQKKKYTPLNILREIKGRFWGH